MCSSIGSHSPPGATPSPPSPSSRRRTSSNSIHDTSPQRYGRSYDRSMQERILPGLNSKDCLLRKRWRIRVKLDPADTTVLVAGGGGVAMKTAQRLRDASCQVYVLQRSDVRAEDIEKIGAKFVIGDALSMADVSKAYEGMDGIDVVVSSVGGTPADPSADSEGNLNLIKGALAKGVEKFILVSSIGVGETKKAIPATIYEALEPVLLAKYEAEEGLKNASDKMEYVIVRPGGLKNEPATGNGVLTADTTICGSIHRDDFSQLIYQCIFSPATKNMVLSAVDKSQLMGEPGPFEVYEP